MRRYRLRQLRPSACCFSLRKARPALEQLEPRLVFSVAIQVDNGVTHQVINGWGTEYTKEYEPNASQISTILSMVYGQLHLNLGQAGQLLEAPVPDFTQTRDSNPDPFVINWNGFQGWQEQDDHDNWINAPSTIPDGNGGYLTARQLGYTDYFLGTSFPNIRWENPWLDPIRQSDVQQYRDKVARELLAYELYYQTNYAEVPPLFQFGNEELSGNHAIYLNGSQDSYPGGATQEMVDLIKTGGQRLADNGLGSVRFLAGSEETEYSSYNLASAILADSVARQYVGVIGYHEYPYGSEYSSLACVLQGSGMGNPPHDGIQIRSQLRSLGQQYGLPVWLTEVSHGTDPGCGQPGVAGDSFNTLRGRAIQIHDDLVYADMAGFFFQGAYWDTVLQQGHFGNYLTLPQLQALDGDSFVVLGDPTTNTWQLTMGAHALGQYSRWVQPGDIRVDATSDNPLVQVTAFHDPAHGRDSFVVINNSGQAQAVTLTLAGAFFGRDLFGEQSTAGALWSPLSRIAPTDSTHVTVVLPALSVTSLAAPLVSRSELPPPIPVLAAPAPLASPSGMPSASAGNERPVAPAPDGRRDRPELGLAALAASMNDAKPSAGPGPMSASAVPTILAELTGPVSGSLASDLASSEEGLPGGSQAIL